jgi:hypothetical protein
MKKSLILILAATAGLATAMPAQARDNRQDMRHEAAWQITPARTSQIRQDISALGTAIDRAAARRTISRREATGLRRQATDVQRLYGQYARGGLTRTEVRNLQDRVNSVRVALRMERRDWDSRRG